MRARELTPPFDLARQVQIKHFKWLLKQAGIRGFVVLSLHAAVGVYPGVTDTAQSLADKIMGRVPGQERKNAKNAMLKDAWFIDEVTGGRLEHRSERRAALLMTTPCLQVCMDDPQLLDLMEEVARLVRGKPDVLMGGIRVYATGDVMQLPPLGTDEQAAPQGMRRRRELATESRLFEGPGAVEIIVFDEVMRQRDPEQLAAFGDLSIGYPSEVAYDFVQTARNVEVRCVALDESRAGGEGGGGVGVDAERHDLTQRARGMCSLLMTLRAWRT